MKFVVTHGGVPAGSYPAVYVGAEPYLDANNRFGEGVKLRFRVDSGEFAGDEAMRIVSSRFTARSNLFAFACALAARELTAGDEFDFSHYVGVAGLILVEQTEGGATRVAAFMRGGQTTAGMKGPGGCNLPDPAFKPNNNKHGEA